jgi:cbb3-type cytochrome oxidase subunit 3
MIHLTNGSFALLISQQRVVTSASKRKNLMLLFSAMDAHKLELVSFTKQHILSFRVIYYCFAMNTVSTINGISFTCISVGCSFSLNLFSVIRTIIFICILFLLAGSNKESGTEKEEQKGGMHPGIVVLIVVLLLGVVAVGLLVGYKYWRKKKRQQEQARFLKLFEDGDDIEDELGLENTL